MAKKYKVLTGVMAALIAAAILVVSVSASSYVSSAAYFVYGFQGLDELNVVESLDRVVVNYEDSTWGFLYDIDFKRHHTYTVDISMNVEFPNSSTTVYPLPGELQTVTFSPLEDISLSGLTTDDVVYTQKNSKGESYSDLMTFTFDSKYDSVKEVFVLNYHLAFSTADGFVDNLSEDIYYMFPYFFMHPEAEEISYVIDFYEINVTSAYDPDGDIYEETVLDQMGAAVSKLNEVKLTLSVMQSIDSAQLEQLTALKESTQALVTQTTEMYNKVVEMNATLDSLPEDIGVELGEQLEQHDKDVYEQVELGGQELFDELLKELQGVIDTDSINSSLMRVVSALASESRVSSFMFPPMYIPAMEGVISKPIKLFDSTQIFFDAYVDMIPEDIMTVVQWLVVVGIVLQAIFTLMRLINEFLQGKTVDGEEGD